MPIANTLTFRNCEKLFKEITDVAAFKKLFCGMRIGKGVSRSVYIFKPNDDYVVKIEKLTDSRYFANVREYANWEYMHDWVLMGHWLAPCIWLSKCGRILIQRRAEREIDGYKGKYPKKLPSLITDRKRKNFGWIDGKFVCVDYPYLVHTDFKLTRSRFWDCGKRK